MKTKDEAISFFMLDDHYGDCMLGGKYHHCWVQVFDIITGICKNCDGQWFDCPCVPESDRPIEPVFRHKT